MRCCSKIAFGVSVAILVAMATVPSFVAAQKQKSSRLALKSGYLADRGLLDRKFCSIQLIVEIAGDGTGQGHVWDDPNIQPDGEGSSTTNSSNPALVNSQKAGPNSPDISTRSS